MENGEHGGYVFISHSHRDIEKVRLIRNAMEKEGFEPLCFYLKCLTDEDEIEGLIKREIDAREWFVYVDSKNSRASDWVAKERAYIDSLGTKQVVNIDLERETSMEDVAARLINGLSVLIRCEGNAVKYTCELKDALIKRDLQVTGLEEAGEGELNGLIVITSKAGKEVTVDPGKLKTVSIENAAAYVEASLRDDLNRLFSKARSHREISVIEGVYGNSAEAERLAREADERLEEERRIKEDILAAVENGTMKMTDELKKKLDGMY